MLGFATTELIEGAMLGCAKSGTFFDLEFPGNEKRDLVDLCRVWRWSYRPMPNLGTAANWMQAWEALGKPDILVGVEPDERPSDPGWIDKAVKVLTLMPELGYVGMGQSHYDTLYKPLQCPSYDVGGIALRAYSEPVGMACGAFRGAFIEQGGICSDPFYGHLEAKTAAAAERLGYDWALFADMFAVHLEGCPAYTRWKIDKGDHKTELGFAQWLEQVWPSVENMP